MKRGVSFLLCLLFFFAVLSCGAQTVRTASPPENDAVQSSIPDPRSPVPEILFPYGTDFPLPEPIPRNGPHFAVIPENPRPGDPVTIAYADNFFAGRDFEAILLDSRGRRQAKAKFFSFATDEAGREVKAALFTVPSTVSPQNMVIRIESPERVVQELPLALADRDFRSERIALDARNTEIRAAPNPQRDIEARQLWAILNRNGIEVYATGAFVPPVSSTRRTSLFGSRRVYQYVDSSTATSIHAGVDYGVPMNTPVFAAARGKVVLARFRIVTGNTVVLEHGPGFYSLYYHLDSIAAEDGLFVEAGALLGLSGTTGLSTGPHLHWEVRIAGENTDPDALVARPILDRDEIMAKLTKYE